MLDRHDAALIASVTFIALLLALNGLTGTTSFQHWAWHNIVANEHCHLTTDTGSSGPRVYQCDDGYRSEGELKTLPDE